MKTTHLIFVYPFTNAREERGDECCEHPKSRYKHESLVQLDGGHEPLYGGLVHLLDHSLALRRVSYIPHLFYWCVLTQGNWRTVFRARGTFYVNGLRPLSGDIPLF